jgi:putative FmdB family regulatory protein
MPLYEFRCNKCGARDEVFARSVSATVTVPRCPRGGDEPGHAMERIMSGFARHLTDGDRLAEAEAKWGAEVESVMGPGPDVGRNARIYDQLAKDLPTKEDA